jgi:hypothetical protein
MMKETNMTELTPFEQEMAKDRETFMMVLRNMLTSTEVKLLDKYVSGTTHSAGMVAQLVATTLRQRVTKD